MHVLVVLRVLLVGLYAGHVTASGGYRLLDHPLDMDVLRTMSEVYMNTQELVVSHGYPAETHVVTTDDGYILTLHRIPHGKDGNASRVRAPVILMHGMFLASDSWLLAGEDSSLGFVLADRGYDVWMGNARGNFYNRRHVTLSTSDPKFWEYSFHEMGVYDLPAVIDYILLTTNQQQLFYIGHSMGCAMFFVLTSTLPEYNAKVKLMVALAPAVYLGTVRSLAMRSILPISKHIVEGAYRSGQLNFIPRTRDLVTSVDMLCKDRRVGRMICEVIVDRMFGLNRGVFNTTLVPSFLAHYAGASIHTLNHFAVNLKSKQFHWYDMERKECATQVYDLAKVTCPVSLHYGNNDMLVHPDGILRLSRELPLVVGLNLIKNDRMGHMEFIIARNAKELIYNDVINIMDTYRSDDNDVA